MTDSEHALLLAMARAMISLLDESEQEMDAHYAQAIQRLAEGIKVRRSPAARPPRTAQSWIGLAERDAALRDAGLAGSGAHGAG